MPTYRKAAFGTIVSLEINNGKNAQNYKNPGKIIWDGIREVEKDISPYIASSSISRLNQAAGKEYIKVGKTAAKLINAAQEYALASEGLFDITIAPLLQLWGFGYGAGHVPRQKEIKAGLELVNYNFLLVRRQNAVVSGDLCAETECMLAKPGQAVHPGGIAKGFVCDFLKNKLNNEQVLLNMGGHVMSINRKSQIGIRSPFTGCEKLAGWLELENSSIATSAVSERCFTRFFKRYHHLLHPKTGRQPEHNLVSVSCISTNSTRADVFATACFIGGKDKSRDFVRNNEMEVLLIDKQKNIYCSPSIYHHFQTTAGFSKQIL